MQKTKQKIQNDHVILIFHQNTTNDHIADIDKLYNNNLLWYLNSICICFASHDQ